MKNAKKIDMTQGPIMRLIILFAIPICFGNILQQLYSTVDTMVIGKFSGQVSLAAVGTSSQPVEIFLCIFLGLGAGVSILVSQFTGGNETDKLKRCVATASSFLYMCAIPISIAGILLSPTILTFMNVPADAMQASHAYLSIIFLGTLGNMGYNMNAGILRGLGDSRATLLFLLISCFVNIVLDLLFVAALRLDVVGAALATIIAMYCSWLFSILFIKRKYPHLEYTILPHSLDKDILKAIIRVGLPLGLNNSIYTVGHVVLQILVNAQGSVFMAACTVAGKINGLANVAITSFSSAATTFAGQNLGAQNYVRLRNGGRRIPLSCGLITWASGIVFILLSPYILTAFTDDPAVLEMALRYVRIVLPSSCLYATFNCIICFVNGMGQVRYSTAVNLLMLWAVRIPVAYLINRFIDGTFIMVCYPISFASGLTAMLFYYRTSHWKSIKQKAQEQASAEALTTDL